MKQRKPNKFFIAIGGFTGTSYQLELKSGKLIYTEFRSGYEKIGDKIFRPKAEQWEAFWQVADDMDIWNWKKEYRNPEMLDGTSWRVRIKFKDKEMDSQGSNNSPDGGKLPKFLSAVRQLINNESFH